MGEGLERVCMYVLKNVLNNTDTVNWHAELGCTGEGRCLMMNVTD